MAGKSAPFRVVLVKKKHWGEFFFCKLGASNTSSDLRAFSEDPNTMSRGQVYGCNSSRGDEIRLEMIYELGSRLTAEAVGGAGEVMRA
jgi:hypothetical protein